MVSMWGVDGATDAAEQIARFAGLGVGGLLLALIFRTLWRMSGDSERLTSSYGKALKAAQDDAKEARADAAAARVDARAAWAAQMQCEARSLATETKLQRQITALRTVIARLHPDEELLDEIDAHDVHGPTVPD